MDGSLCAINNMRYFKEAHNGVQYFWRGTLKGCKWFEEAQLLLAEQRYVLHYVCWYSPSSRRVAYETNGSLKKFKLLSRECFGEDVSKLILRGNIGNRENFFIYKFSNLVVFNFDMLDPWVFESINYYLNVSFVV